jgi:hypothetical protein
VNWISRCEDGIAEAMDVERNTSSARYCKVNSCSTIPHAE